MHSGSTTRSGALCLLVVVAILVMSLMPLLQGSTRLVPDVLLNLGHLPAYGLLALVGLRLLLGRGWPRRRAAVVAGAVALGLGAALELVQPWFGRNMSLKDLIADAVGVALGLLLGHFLLARRRS